MGRLITPRPFAEFDAASASKVQGVFCDIDDTLTWHGRLVPEAFMALQRAHEAGLKVVPITGRPAGWVDHIARMWPVDGVVGENGGLWFYMHEGRLHRRFAQSPEERAHNRSRLDALAASVLSAVPGSALASDQPYRELDLAIDFCEDVPPLGDDAIDAIVSEFEAAGAVCKVSSIHVNGWYGHFDKLSGCAGFLADRWNSSLEDAEDTWLYVGDSANDEPMFSRFSMGIGVANVVDFLPRMKAWPRYVTQQPGGAGFADIIDRVLEFRSP